MRNARLGVLVLALLVTGCGTGSESASPPLAIGLAENLQFSCGIGHAFRSDLFAQPGNDESANDPWSATLRRFLDRHAEPEFIPEHGWYLAGGDAQSATYVAPDAGGIGFVEVTLAMGQSGWEVDSYGACRPSVVLNGLGNASWMLDPDLPQPDASDTEFVALVTERACASGQSSEGRVSPPVILYEADRILVIFGVRPLPGAQRCPGNPSTRVVVHLDQPIGARRLFDGSFLPPHDPTLPL